jgi:hypothetical protein
VVVSGAKGLAECEESVCVAICGARCVAAVCVAKCLVECEETECMAVCEAKCEEAVCVAVAWRDAIISVHGEVPGGMRGGSVPVSLRDSGCGNCEARWVSLCTRGV